MLVGSLFLVAPSAARAEELTTYFWLPRTGSGCSMPRERVESVLYDVLANATDARHIVGVRGLQRELQERGFPLPPCLEGLSGCEEPADAVVDAFAASMLVEVTLTDGCRKASVEVADPLTRSQQVHSFEGRDARDVLFKLVSDITGSKGEFTVTSTPSGANVFVNGAEVGQTPLHLSLDLGPYTLRVETDGYFAFDESYELRAGDRLLVDAPLNRRFAALTVRSGVPAAYLLFGDDPTPHPVNEVSRVEPGDCRLTVAAPGYDPVVSNLRLVAGEDRELRVVLYESEATVDARQRARIEGSPWVLGARVGLMRTSPDWADAEDVEGRGIRCPTGDDPESCIDGVGTNLVSVTLDPVFTWRTWQVLPLGGTVAFGASPDAAKGYRLKDGFGEDPGDTFAWRIRFLQGGYRRIVNQYWEPHVLAGFAVGRSSLSIGSIVDDKDVLFTRNAFLFEAHGGVRFHLNPRIHADAQLELATDLADGGEPSVGFSLGFGVNLDDPTGLKRALDAAHPASAAGDGGASPPKDL
jgi:hypothetical protein